MKAINNYLDSAAQYDVIAARARSEGMDPAWHVEHADSFRRQAYSMYLEALHGERACTRCLQAGHTRLGEHECREPFAPVPPITSWLHTCESCKHTFLIERHETTLFAHHRTTGTARYLLLGTGKNMVYKGDMNREYAMCPACGVVEHQFSAEARDQTDEHHRQNPGDPQH